MVGLIEEAISAGVHVDLRRYHRENKDNNTEVLIAGNGIKGPLLFENTETKLRWKAKLYKTLHYCFILWAYCFLLF
jgi:hypothetical protein